MIIINSNCFYANKIQQINIVGEYVRKMLSGNSDALEFVDDYFQLNYSSFLQKYFPGKRRDEINRKMTNTKLQRLLGELSETQLEIVKDDRPGSIVVMAGPGSGKTRVLVHKLAYLLLEEDVKHEQLLMLTFFSCCCERIQTTVMGFDRDCCWLC